jgi:hypothetical protein
MSDGIDHTNSKNIDSHYEFRFRDAAQAIYYKYQTVDTIEPSGTNVAASVYMAPGRQITTTRSRACTIL